MEVEHHPPTVDRPALEIHRSPRRRRGATARARGDTIVVRLPAGLPAAEDARLVDRLVEKVTGRARAEALGGDEGLHARALALADRYLDGVRPSAVRFSSRMTQRLGSCTPTEGTIRISEEVAGFPAWVRDYVLLHELAHLRVPDHSPAFHQLLSRYPRAERARGWLEGYAAGRLHAGRHHPEGSDPATPPAAGASPGDGRG